MVPGLATLALLKVYFDAGQDHIEMFLPFTLDTIKAGPLDGFALADLKTAILTRHGLDIPAPALNTLLHRAVRRNHLRREAGRYWTTASAPITIDISEARAHVEREHLALATSLLEFAANHTLQLATTEAALTVLLSFLQEHHGRMLLEPDPSQAISSPEILSRKETRVVARFIHHIHATDPVLTNYVQRMG